MRIILFLIFSIPISIFAQNSEIKEQLKLYNTEQDATSDLEGAIFSAQQMNKHVLIQVGGNWCPWCIKLHQFIEAQSELDSIIRADYILLRINYSKENRNLPIMKKLEYPQRFGFPVLVILDENGKRLHTQDTGFLEKDESYDIKKLKRFLLTWNKEALKDEKYLEK